MVITCFNFMIAHPIITPNSVIGKFMYTKAVDDGGDRACHICSCHCSLCLLGRASQDHPVRLAATPFFLSITVRVLGVARMTQTFPVHSSVPCVSASRPDVLNALG